MHWAERESRKLLPWMQLGADHLRILCPLVCLARCRDEADYSQCTDTLSEAVHRACGPMAGTDYSPQDHTGRQHGRLRI